MGSQAVFRALHVQRNTKSVFVSKILILPSVVQSSGINYERDQTKPVGKDFILHDTGVLPYLQATLAHPSQSPYCAQQQESRPVARHRKTNWRAGDFTQRRRGGRDAPDHRASRAVTDAWSAWSIIGTDTSIRLKAILEQFQWPPWGPH